MMGIHDLALFIAAGLLLNVTPGPDMAYIAARGAAGGFRAGMAFGVIKWRGAAYLLYAGVRLVARSEAARRPCP